MIHALPALTDAARAIPGITFDWVVEEGFAEIPTWHYGGQGDSGGDPPLAQKISGRPSRAASGPLQQNLRARKYDPGDRRSGPGEKCLVDPLREAPVAGLDKDSAREPLASRFYQRRLAVAREAARG